MNRTLLKALAEMESGDERPDVKPLMSGDIREWARNEGQLPPPSADAFAVWLEEEFCSFNEDGDKTNEQVLKGALSHWTGGRA